MAVANGVSMAMVRKESELKGGSGCYLKQEGNCFVVCNPDGSIIVGQRDSALNFPMGGISTVTVELICNGIAIPDTTS